MLKNSKKELCKALSMLLAAVLMATMFPITASAADTPAFAVGYPKSGEVQADGSKKVQVLVKGVLPEAATDMSIGYVLLADGDSAPTAEQIKSAGGKIPGVTVITWAQHGLGDSQQPITLTGVQDDTDYEFYAVLWKDDVFSEVKHLDVKTPAAGSADPGTSMLAPPTGLRWEGTAPGVKAKWNAVPSATSYEVTLYKEGSSFMLRQYPGVAGTEINPDIYSTGSYYFTVQAKAEGYTSSVKPASPVFSYIAPLNGTATIDNMSPKVGDTLTGSLVYGNNTGTLHYTWKAGDFPVGADAASYTVAAGDLGKTITLEITSDMETGTRTSTATAAVAATTKILTVSTPSELETALGTAAGGDTIKLLNDINYNQGIVIDGKSFCLDLGSYTLNVVNSTGIGIDIKNAILTVSGDGKFNATGTKGVQAQNSIISVYSATGTAGAGVEAFCGFDKSCEVTVTTLAQGTTAGVYAMNDNCKITAASAKATGSAGKAVYAEVGGTIEISGNIDAPNGYGVYCVNGSATIGGHVTGKNTAVYLYEKGSIVISGNVNADNGNGTAVEIAGNGTPSNGTVTIEGTVSVSDASYVRFINGVRIKNDGVSDGAYLKYTDSVDGEKAGIIRVKKVNAACAIGVQEFTSLSDALAAASSGDTITLLQNITHIEHIKLEKNTINLDLGNYNLLLDTSADPLFSPALMVIDGGKVKLTGEGTGEFHVKGRSGISAVGVGVEVTVHTVETEDGSGVNMYGSGDLLESNSTVTVLGSAIAGKNSIAVGNGTGVNMNAKGGKVFVTGNIASGRDGVYIASNPGTQVTVNGNITVTSDSPTASLVGIRAYGATTAVTVTGDVTVLGADCLGIHASASTIKVGGNVASFGKGAHSDANGKVEITGSLTAGSPFIVVGTTEMTADQGTETGGESLLYTDGENTVQIGSVGVPASTYAVTVIGGSGASGAGSYKENETVTINAGSRSNYSFVNWTSSDGITITNATSKIASFTMPGHDVTVTANWSYNSSGSSSYRYYTITAGADKGGGISPSGNLSVREGMDKVFTITPDTGYVISDVLVDGKSVGALKTYTFTNVTGAHTIKASFVEEDKHNLDAGANIPFTDVAVDDWYVSAVMWAYGEGLMAGTGAATFSPHAATTRGMIVAILYRLEGSPAAGANGFSDVVDGKYYADAVAWAAENNIVSGYGDGRFGPEDSITREQLAVILMNYTKFKGYDVNAKADLSKFSDAAAVSGWALDAMIWANAAGLIQGDGTKLIPAGSAERCQVAAILQRFIENIVK